MLAGTVSRGRMSYQKRLLLVFISPELFPVFHCCFQRLPKIIKWWVWIRMLSNTVPCTETRSVWDFVCILRVESLFPTGLQVSCTEALLAFKARYSASGVPGAGAWACHDLCAWRGRDIDLDGLSGRDENLKILSLQQQGPKSSPLSLIPWLTLEPHVSQLCHHWRGPQGTLPSLSGGKPRFPPFV